MLFKISEVLLPGKEEIDRKVTVENRSCTTSTVPKTEACIWEADVHLKPSTPTVSTAARVVDQPFTKE